MATITQKSNGRYLAQWKIDGVIQSQMTRSRSFETAMKEANKFEAIARFHEDVPIFKMLAAMRYSADFCHRNFTHRSHLPAREFRALLRQVGVQFVAPSRQLDKKRPTPKPAKKYDWKGAKRSLEEIATLEDFKGTSEALRQQIERGKLSE